MSIVGLIPAYVAPSTAPVAPAVQITQAAQYRTTADQAQLHNAVAPAPFQTIGGLGQNAVVVDPTRTYQPFLGVGAALTEASAYCLVNYLTDTQRTALLTELFSPSQCGWSTVRIAFGSHSFSAGPTNYTYDDMPAGQTDPNLVNFSIAPDGKYLIPLLQQILAINPRVRVQASVWTPPAWMKTTGSLGIPASRTISNPATTSDLNMSYVGVYADYIVAAVQAFKQLGIPIWAVSPCNEPFDTVGSITYFTDADYATMVAAVGSAFDNARIEAKILAHDHNPSQLANAVAAVTSTTSGPYIENVAWHDYGSPNWAQASALHRRAPDVAQHVTEMRTLLTQGWGAAMGIAAGDLAVGAVRNWSSSITMWNLALDQNGNPFRWLVSPSPGSQRRGLVTIQNDGTGTITRFAEYYVLKHLGSQVKPGAVRIDSTSPGYGANAGVLQTSAFTNPDGSVVLFAYNSGSTSLTFQIIDARTQTGFPVTMTAGEVSTFVWGTTAVPASAGTLTPIAVPGAPVASVGSGKGEIKVTWTAPSTGGAPITQYQVFSGATPGSETLLATVTGGNLFYWDTLGSAATRYYTVRAFNAGGLGPVSNEVTATAAAPAVPDVPTVTATVAYGATTLAFSVGHFNGSKVTSYNILRSTTSGAEAQYATANQGASSYVDTGVTAGTTYFYKVAAVNATGTATSAEVSAASPALQAATVNTTATVGTASSAANSDSISWSHTVGTGQHRLLLVALSQSTGSTAPNVGSSVTYGGAKLNRLGEGWGAGTGGNGRAIDLFYLLNPPSGTATISAGVPASGITVTWGGVSSDLFNVDQSNPLGTLVTAGAAATDVTTIGATATTSTTTADILFAAAVARTTTAPTPGGGQTSIASQVSASNTYTVASTQTAAGTSTSASWTWTVGDSAAAVAVAVHGG